MPIRDFWYKCWQCKLRFLGHSFMPCLVDEICPRCGAGCRAWQPTDEDKRIGTRYFDVGTGLYLRSGREHQDLWAHGYLKLKTHDADILEVCDPSDYTPTS